MASAKSVVVVILLIVVSSSSSKSKAVAVVAAGGKCSGSSSGGSRGGCSSGGGDPRAWITHPPFDPYPMDRGMDRVWVWVCDPSLMFLAVAIWSALTSLARVANKDERGSGADDLRSAPTTPASCHIISPSDQPCPKTDSLKFPWKITVDPFLPVLSPAHRVTMWYRRHSGLTDTNHCTGTMHLIKKHKPTHRRPR